MKPYKKKVAPGLNYKIIEILKTFDAKDKKNFERFLRSPFHNESAKLISLYRLLMKYHPDFNSLQLNEEHLSRQLNPDLPYNRSTFKRLLFDLANAAEEFLTYVAVSNSGIRKDDFLRDEYLKRALYRQYEGSIKRSEKNIVKEDIHGFDHYNNLFRLYTDKANHFIVSTPNSNRRFVEKHIELHSERLKILSFMFIHEVMNEFDNMMHINRVYDINHEKNFITNVFEKVNIEEIGNFIIQNTSDRNHLLMLKLTLAQFVMHKESNNEERYFEFKKLVFDNTRKMNTTDINTYMIRMMRYCLLRMDDDEQGYDWNSELFQLYKTDVEKGYYRAKMNVYMPVELYRMALLQALKMKEFGWAMTLIRKHSSKLNPDRKDNLIDYGLALYHFHTKELDEALRYLRCIKFDHFVFKMDYKNLMLMIYYDLGMYEPAFSLIDSYKHFIKKGGILNYTVRMQMKNFIHCLEKMIRYKTSVKRKAKHQLDDCLNTDLQRDLRIWLREKLSAINNDASKSA